MSDDLFHVGEGQLQRFHQSDEGGALCICPCVGGAAFLVQSADVADADGTLVPAHTMRPVEGDVPSRFDGAVEADDVMIADGPEATGTVPAVDVGSGDVLSRTGGGTVDDDGVFHCRNSFLCPLSLGNI